MYYNPNPRGFFDTGACVPLMGVHVQPFPTPSEFGSFNVYTMYNHSDPQKINIGLDMIFTGRNQNNPYLENFVRFFNNPEPCSSLHLWFGSFPEIRTVCPFNPADPNSPVAGRFAMYRPIGGEGNNIQHPTWGGEGRPYTHRIRDAQVRGYAFDYHAHWGVMIRLGSHISMSVMKSLALLESVISREEEHEEHLLFFIYGHLETLCTFAKIFCSVSNLLLLRSLG